MAILDFPNPATVGQRYTSDVGSVYEFDGEVWTSVSGAGGPAPPGSGLVVVAHDTLLAGDGTGVDPLAVAVVDTGSF
jgi:hypothetical protein